MKRIRKIYSNQINSNTISFDSNTMNVKIMLKFCSTGNIFVVYARTQARTHTWAGGHAGEAI